MVERFPYKEDVGSSSLSTPTIFIKNLLKVLFLLRFEIKNQIIRVAWFFIPFQIFRFAQYFSLHRTYSLSGWVPLNFVQLHTAPSRKFASASRLENLNFLFDFLRLRRILLSYASLRSATIEASTPTIFIKNLSRFFFIAFRD